MSKDRETRRVTRAIKLALAMIADQDPELGRVLSETIKTGEYLSYSPGPPPTPGRKSEGAKKTQHQHRKNPIQLGRK